MKKLYLMIILLVALSGSLFGENPYEKYSSDFVRINVQSLEKQLFMEYNNREFKTMTMAKAAFIASGVTSKPELDAYMTRFDAVIKGIKKNYPNLSSLPQRRQGEIILKYIHKHVFKKYLFWSTTFKHIFDKGEFNCLISAVFFNAVCEEFNLKTRGTTNYNHAVSMFYAGNVVYRVETTNNGRFKPVSQGEARKDKTYNNVQLVAAVWGNLSAYSHKAGEFEKGIALGYKSLRLSPVNRESLMNFKANYDGLAGRYIYDKKFLSAISLSREIMDKFPNDKDFQKNISTYIALQNSHYIQKREFDKAKSFLDEQKKSHPGLKIFGKLYRSIYIQKGIYLHDQKEFGETVANYEAGLKEFPNDKILYNNYMVVLNNYIVYLIKKENFSQALNISESARLKYPKEKVFQKYSRHCKRKLKK